MNTINISISEVQPKIIEYLGDGTYYYNYNITQETVQLEDGESTQYTYIPILIRGHANYKDCVKYTIRKFISQDEEFDLINSYNKAVLTNSVTTEDKDKYTKYLELLDTIKFNVKKDFNI